MKNLSGIALMIVAMAGFALEDLFVKLLSSTISTGQILVVLGVCSSTVFASLARSQGHELFAAHAWTRVTMARAVVEAIGAVAFVTSLALVPLSTVAAVFQVTPLVITMGGALFLGERVGWRRWSAVIVGFVGVLIIIRPGFSGFDPFVLFVLVSVLFIAARDLITRKIPKEVASTVISFQAFASLICVGTLLMVVKVDPWVAISKLEAAYFLGGVIFGVAGYYGLVAAMRVGDVSTIMPFRYTRLLFSIAIGVALLGERPDRWTLLGAAIIIATGLYTFVRERKASPL